MVRGMHIPLSVILRMHSVIPHKRPSSKSDRVALDADTKLPVREVEAEPSLMLASEAVWVDESVRIASYEAILLYASSRFSTSASSDKHSSGRPNA